MKNIELDKQVLSIIIKDDGTFNSGKSKISYFELFYHELLKYMNNRFNDLCIEKDFREIIFRLKNNIEETPLCPVCGKPLPFDYKRYRVFCCDECKKSEKGKQLTKMKTIQTCLSQYGTQSVSASDQVKQKRIKNSLEKYGVDHPNKNKEIANKISQSLINKTLEEKEEIIKKEKATKFKKYGNENFVNPDKAKQTKLEKYGDQNFVNPDKAKQTKLEKYGDQNFSNSEKTKQTCLEKYGYAWVTQTEFFKEKRKDTMIEKYGVEFSLQSEELKGKFKETMFNRYGIEYSAQDKEINEKQIKTKKKRYNDDFKVVVEKTQKTCIEKYGYAAFNPNKAKQTCLERYGCENPQQNKEINAKTWETRKRKGNTNTSAIEISITNWLSSNNIKFQRNFNKDNRYPYHVDFYLDDFDVFIEVQGYWTHGCHAFDEANEDDIEKLNKWKQKSTEHYDNAIKVWTVTDPLKRQVAKENKLNFLELFTCNADEAIEQIKNYISNK